MRNDINKQKSQTNAGKLVSTKKENSNIYVETNDIDNNIVRVLHDNAEFSNNIGLNIHSKSNGNEVHISFNESENFNIFDNVNDNEDENNKNNWHYNDSIVNVLANYKNPK